ncbi:hypothetical protein OG884_17335 [Streptosporangium sp. NBC_01755]|uniref:hypothetical protein n=1 Tax=unclassified Streptosporangium TaxID=2632669 RepID=UPI002DDBA488|nr:MULTISPECIES: hypothetical protein [unclassified Streptosporangium]WSA25080.1 hypothetical protein OIE13_29770 [Streptosporangium sp. NBC_01810]WSD03578.1 hypothetical protein OG884_17335 [Streptosporangium sp. NBC_01755]
MVLAVIIGCEIGFWILLGLGLVSRYLWGMRRLSTALLLAVPLLDVVLLIASVIDMRGGAQADWRHGLAAAYLAYSIVFGHRTITWADARFAHRFAGGPEPWKPPSGGVARARYEWGIWLRIVLAYGIACALLFGLILIVDDPSRTVALNAFMTGALKVPLIAVLWPVSYTLFPEKVARNGVAGNSSG